MAIVKGANVTKYDAGGSGDNVIADGFIKTVEKVWIDTYSVTAAIPTTTSIAIAKVPKGKKLTDVIVYLPVLGGASASLCTVNCGTAATNDITTVGTLGLLLLGGRSGQTFSIATATTLALGPTGALVELGVDSTIYIQLGLPTTITGCTIRTIVKWT